MRRYTKEEIRRIEGDNDFWKEIEKYLPWKLHGFSDRYSAHFVTQLDQVKFTGIPLYDAVVPSRANPRAFIVLTGEQRNQIVNSFSCLKESNEILWEQLEIRDLDYEVLRNIAENFMYESYDLEAQLKKKGGKNARTKRVRKVH